MLTRDFFTGLKDTDSADGDARTSEFCCECTGVSNSPEFGRSASDETGESVWSLDSGCDLKLSELISEEMSPLDFRFVAEE